MKVVTSYGNFSRARVDHDMQGRFDLPIYNNAADVFENFISNFKGNAIYDTGFLYKLQFEDCFFIEFKFNANQNYICAFYAGKIRFLAFDTNNVLGWVLNGSSTPLEVTTPYTLAESKELDYAQNFDVMYVTHGNYEPRKLRRISANNFTFSTYTRTDDPFTAPNWPAKVAIRNARLYFGRTAAKGTTIWGSEDGAYDVFTVPGTPTDISAFTFTIAAMANPIDFMFDGDNSLIIGSSDLVVALNGGQVNTAITASTIDATSTSAEPVAPIRPLKKDGLLFYVGRTLRNLFYFKYDILQENFLAQDANFLSFDITKGNLGKIRHKKDRNDLIYSVKGDGNIVSLNFQEAEKINGWHDRKTNGSFKDLAVIADRNGNQQLITLTVRNGVYYIEQKAEFVEYVKQTDFYTGDKEADKEAYNRYLAEQLRDSYYLDGAITFDDLHSNTIVYDPDAGTITAVGATFVSGDVNKHIVYKSLTGYESGRFLITGYVSTTVVNVSVLQTPTANIYSSWYLTFTTLTGLSQFNGTEVGIVTDGGYLGDFTISGGSITFGAQTASVILGYKYRGVIKSFCLGFTSSGINTQTTVKAINQMGLRCVASVGGKIGSSMYEEDLDPVQQLSQADINYLPPLPIDGTAYVNYVDEYDLDKYFYVVQDVPGPMHICNVMLQAEYATRSL